MSGHGEKFTRKMEVAIAALISAPSIAEAAKLAGIAEVTLWRWMKDTEFQSYYREARKQAVSQAISKLQKSSSEAVDVLKEVAEDKEASPNARVSAAKTILEMALKASELEDVISRIEELEKLADKNS